MLTKFVLYFIHLRVIIDLYYQRDYKRLPLCTLPVHGLLHVVDDIRYHVWSGTAGCSEQSQPAMDDQMPTPH